MMKKRQNQYDHIVEAIQYYAYTDQHDELCGIIMLFEQKGFSQDFIFHLLGDTHLLFEKTENAKIAYQKAAQLYQQLGKKEEAEALKAVINRM
jgi:DNA-binding transcriptional MerR regulator